MSTVRCLEVEPGRARVRDAAPPPLPDGWGRVRVSACGVCGTDLHLLHGMELPRHCSYPLRPGHEVAGRVIEGSAGRVRLGDQVVLHPLIPCGRCDACRSDHENRCRYATRLGFDHPGGLAEEIVWPLHRMVPTPRLPPKQAAVLPDAVASAYHALKLAELPAGGALTVLGAGGVGIHVLALARVLDPTARLTAVVRSPGSEQRLRRLGLDAAILLGADDVGRRVLGRGGPQDAVIEFGAGAHALAQATPMLARGGRLVVGSMSEEPLDLGASLAQLVTRELYVIGSYASTIADLGAVVHLATTGRLDLSASVSHQLPLERAAEAFELLERRPTGLARVVVVP
ncbi:MAG TPA: alcohol dehydrogenase catalytic domain-containing protein [Solirubrobacteraceae bacterium]|nr:alcohol dehydrogenase catalytic domain-containing protein [Solirubrobacteraceae bacterium]